MKKRLLLFNLSLILVFADAHSQEIKNPLIAKFLIEGGGEYGGDEILTVFFTDGGDQKMRAGQGVFLALGGQFEFQEPKNFMLRASMGIKYTTTAADNANIRLTRLPIDLMPYWIIKEDFRLGVGITSHQNVRFKGDGFVEDIGFKGTLGTRFEIGYNWIAVTYTILDYKSEMGEKFSANSVGLSLSYVFSNK
ncbi:MAG: hypothetical protein WBG71_03165 [Leeuwenhoekiella sp.]